MFSASAILIDKTVALWAGGGSVAPAAGQAATSNSNAFHLANKEMISMTTLKLTKILAAAVVAACAVTLGLGLDQALSQNPTNGNAAGRHLDSGDTAANDDPFSNSTTAVVVQPTDESAESPSGGAKNNPYSADSADEDADPFGATSENTTAANSRPPTSKRKFFDLKPRSEAEIQIRRSLTEKSEFEFFDTPLPDAVAEIGRHHSINVVLDRFTLGAEGIDPSAPVTGTYRGISLRSALTLLLGDLDLTYVIANEVMLITTPTEAERHMETRLYPIPKSWGISPDDLIRAMTGTVAVDSWEEVGGPGNVEALGNDNLVIMQTSKVHEEIHDLLRQIDAAAEMRRR